MAGWQGKPHTPTGRTPVDPSRPKVGRVAQACAVLSWLGDQLDDDDDRFEVARVRQRLIDVYEMPPDLAGVAQEEP